MAEQRKHIVFILSDQHHPNVAGYAGDAFVRTPNLDRLASRGTVFDAAYCPSPLCVPSRMAMMAGALPNVTKCYDNQSVLRSDQATFAHCLDQAGYHTVLAGRMHFNGPDQRHGFNERLVGDITSTVAGGPEQPYGQLENTTWGHPDCLRLSGGGHSSVLEYDQAVVDAAVCTLRDYDRSEPLFLTVGLYEPHCPFVCPPELYQYYYDLLPEFPEQRLREPLPELLSDGQVFNRKNNSTCEDVRRARAAYYGLVENMDRHIGAVVDAAERKWGAENVLIVYASDHGETLGEHGLFWKENFYDASARVPMIFRLPGKIPAGQRCASPVSLLDIGPTFIGLVEGPELPGCQGENLWPILTGKQGADPGREVVSILGRFDPPRAMIRYKQWKLIRYHNVLDQLFDLENDPDELTNLADSPHYASLREDLARRLEKWWNGDEIAREQEMHMRHQKLLMPYGAKHASVGENEQIVIGEEFNRLEIK